jgi:hypothetical protein
VKSVALIGCSSDVKSAYLNVPMRDGREVRDIGEVAIVGVSDRLVPFLSEKLESFYPRDVAHNLIRKDRMPSLLGGHGFKELETIRLKGAMDATLKNFIIKPVLGAGSAPMASDYSAIWYKKFNDVSEMLDKFDADTINGAIRFGAIAQQAVMGRKHITASVCGTVNGKGEVYFVRSALSEWDGSFRVHTIRGHDLRGSADIKVKLREFISKSNIRNAAFSLQLLELDGEFYPMDWNFHLPAPYVFDALKIRPEEFHAAIHHMTDSYVDSFDVPKEKWFINRKEASNNVVHMLDKYKINEINVVNNEEKHANPAG